MSDSPARWMQEFECMCTSYIAAGTLSVIEFVRPQSPYGSPPHPPHAQTGDRVSDVKLHQGALGSYGFTVQAYLHFD